MAELTRRERYKLAIVTGAWDASALSMMITDEGIRCICAIADQLAAEDDEYAKAKALPDEFNESDQWCCCECGNRTFRDMLGTFNNHPYCGGCLGELLSKGFPADALPSK